MLISGITETYNFPYYCLLLFYLLEVLRNMVAQWCITVQNHLLVWV